MRGSSKSRLFIKINSYALVSIVVCQLMSGAEALAWPAVIQNQNQDKLQNNELPDKQSDTSNSKSGESRITKGIQKTLAEGHYRLGLRLKKKKQWEEALTQFLESTNKNPSHFKSFFEQALIYRQKELHDMAVTCLEQALTIKPKYKDAKVLLATLQLEKGNVGVAFQQLKESLGMLPENHSDNDSGRDADTILQTIHTFIETSQIVASVLAPKAVQVFPVEEKATVDEVAVKEVIVPEKTSEATLIAKQAVLVINQNKNTKSKINQGPPKKTTAKKPEEDEWTRKLRYLAHNGTGSLKDGEAFFFTEDSGEAILMLADGRRIVRTVDSPKDRQSVVEMRRPDILVPDDLLYNLSLLGKVVAEKVSSPLDAPGSSQDKSSDSMGSYASQATRQPSDSLMQEKTPPSFKLESGRSDNFSNSIEPKRMVHWLKDAFHM